MAKDYNGPDLERIGIFKEMSYIEGPISQSHKASKETASKGSQMLTKSSKSKSAAQDGYFDKVFVRAFEGDSQIDMIRLRRLDRLEKAKKNIGPPFKSTYRMKKPCGKGSYYGTFGQEGKIPEYFSGREKEPEKHVTSSAKNFYTKPPKKGSGYQYADVGINKYPPHTSENDGSKDTSELDKGKQFEPYRAGRFPQDYFSEYHYESSEASDKNETKNEDKSSFHKKPFLPIGPAKKDGGMKAGCIGKYPEHQTDIFPESPEAHRDEDTKVIRAGAGVKPYPVKSIITKNVEKQITPLNFQRIKKVVYCKD